MFFINFLRCLSTIDFVVHFNDRLSHNVQVHFSRRAFENSVIRVVNSFVARLQNSLAYKLNRGLCVSGLGLSSSMALALVGLLHSMHSNTMSDFTTLERMFAFEKLSGVNVMDESGEHRIGRAQQQKETGAAGGAAAGGTRSSPAVEHAMTSDGTLMGQMRGMMDAWNSTNRVAELWREKHGVSSWQSYRNTFGRLRPVYLWFCPCRFGFRDPAPEPQPAPDFRPPFVDHSLLSVHIVK